MPWFSSRIQKQHGIPVFRGRKRTCSGAGARPRKDRNPFPEPKDAGMRTVALLFKTREWYSLRHTEPDRDREDQLPAEFMPPVV
jgi:hypothetical protein